jgi:hypothetical protein
VVLYCQETEFIELLEKKKKQAWWRQGLRMCDGLEVGSYGCGTCSLAPVGFWEKMPLLAKKIMNKNFWGNFIKKFTRSNTCCIFKTSGKK